MSDYTACTMTPDEVIVAVLKRPALYGLCHTPSREQIADVIQAHTKQPDTGECCGWVIRDFATQVLHWADAIQKLVLEGEENE